MIELAEIKAGPRVLDIATGIGVPAITVANQVGNSGHVLAADISSQMLSIARQRATSSGLQHLIEFKQADAKTIDLPASTFDAVLCRWGLMFLPDLQAGLSNICRSLVDGGHLSAAVWASPGEDTLSAAIMNTVMKETNSSPPPPGNPRPFSLSDENALKNFLIKSGFKDVIIERVNVTFDFDSPEDFATFMRETAGPIQVMLSNQTQEKNKIY